MKRQKLDSKVYRFIKFNCIAALFIGAAILLYACENDIEKIQAFSSPENLPVVEAVNFETLFTDSGQVRYSVKAKQLLRFDIDGVEFIEFPKGVEIIQYDAQQKVVSSLTSDYAKQFVKEERWEAKNNVIATNLAGDTLKTEHLIWEEKTEKIYTEEFVEIVREDGTYTGIGLTADESLQEWRINKLKGIIYVEVQEKNSKNLTSTDVDIKEKKDKPFDGPIQLKK